MVHSHHWSIHNVADNCIVWAEAKFRVLINRALTPALQFDLLLSSSVDASFVLCWWSCPFKHLNVCNIIHIYQVQNKSVIKTNAYHFYQFPFIMWCKSTCFRLNSRLLHFLFNCRTEDNNLIIFFPQWHRGVLINWLLATMCPSHLVANHSVRVLYPIKACTK